MDEFKTAWSYFIASVLTLIYYQESDKSPGLPQGFNADNYTKSILGYVDKQCSRGINHFHIVKLLWLIYDEKQNSGFIDIPAFLPAKSPGNSALPAASGNASPIRGIIIRKTS
ncbi:MAG: hypothetical protein Ct9H300mP28_01320 [Pseudomonadota bacterium]|nr:MAG: hypothetical protein Ct9H300mP28_01320 [Pseudomonadota bacterium]